MGRGPGQIIDLTPDGNGLVFTDGPPPKLPFEVFKDFVHLYMERFLGWAKRLLGMAGQGENDQGRFSVQGCARPVLVGPFPALLAVFKEMLPVVVDRKSVV